MVGTHRTYENHIEPNRGKGCTYMKKNRRIKWKKFAECGACRERLSAEELLQKGELMAEYSDRGLAVFRWTCTRGHLSFTAVAIDRLSA